MIYYSIHSKSEPSRLPQAIAKVVAYLAETDFANMELGEYELDGRRMFAQLMEAETAPADTRRPEVHSKYIDVQFLVSGTEGIGFTHDTGKYEVDEDLLEERDIKFYKKVDNEGMLHMTPGSFAVFFPEDVHRPACQIGESGKIRKVVVKVSVELV